METVFSSYSSLFSFTTFPGKTDVGNAKGAYGSANLYTSVTSSASFEQKLSESGLSESKQNEARAVFQVLSSADIVEIGVISQQSNTAQGTLPSSRNAANPSQSQEYRGVTNPSAIALFNDPNKTTEGIQTTLTSQPVSGTTIGGGAYGFFPQPVGQETPSPQGGTFKGALLINPATKDTPSFGDPVFPTDAAAETKSIIKSIQGVANQNIVTPK